MYLRFEDVIGVIVLGFGHVVIICSMVIILWVILSSRAFRWIYWLKDAIAGFILRFERELLRYLMCEDVI